VDNGTLSMQAAAVRCGMAYRTPLRMVRPASCRPRSPGKEWRLKRPDVKASIER
jgi:hypothetical protein